MKKRIFLLLAPLFIFSLTGCGGKEESPPSSPPPAQTAPSAAENTAAGGKTVDPATAGILRGHILFEGNAPAPVELSMRGNPECAVLHPGGTALSEEVVVKDGHLKNAFVYIKEGLEGYSFPVPAAPVVIANKGCVYLPHVSGAQTGQAIQFLNEDQTLHNVHAFAKANPSWNIGLPFAGIKQTKKFQNPEIMVSLKCDVHPWMTGYVGVLPHPYFSVSDENGAFEIKDLPPGDYVVESWHEKFGARSQNIKIEPRETKEIEFKFVE